MDSYIIIYTTLNIIINMVVSKDIVGLQRDYDSAETYAAIVTRLLRHIIL